MACFRPVPYLGRDRLPGLRGRVIIPGENDMASLFPELAREWNPEKNGTLRPSQVTPASKRRVWWICPLGHTYAAAVGARTGQGSGCPYCAGKKVLAGFNDLGNDTALHRGPMASEP